MFRGMVISGYLLLESLNFVISGFTFFFVNYIFFAGLYSFHLWAFQLVSHSTQPNLGFTMFLDCILMHLLFFFSLIIHI